MIISWLLAKNHPENILRRTIHSFLNEVVMPCTVCGMASKWSCNAIHIAFQMKWRCAFHWVAIVTYFNWMMDSTRLLQLLTDVTVPYTKYTKLLHNQIIGTYKCGRETTVTCYILHFVYGADIYRSRCRNPHREPTQSLLNSQRQCEAELEVYLTLLFMASDGNQNLMHSNYVQSQRA